LGESSSDGIHGTASGHWGAGATKSAFDWVSLMQKNPKTFTGRTHLPRNGLLLGFMFPFELVGQCVKNTALSMYSSGHYYDHSYSTSDWEDEPPTPPEKKIECF